MATTRFDKPELDNIAKAEKPMLPANLARPPWVYLHNAMGWECVCTGDDPANPEHYEWLPILQRIEGEDGVGGVSYSKESGRFNFSAAIAGHASLKARSYAIHPDDRRLGRWVNYNARFYPCHGGKKRYVEPGEGLTILSNGSVIPKPDAKEFQAFLVHLKTAGLVEPMQVEIFELAVKRIEDRLPRLRRADRPTKDSEIALARMRAAWSRESAKALSSAVDAEVEVDAEPLVDAGPVAPPTIERSAAGVPQARPQAKPPQAKPPAKPKAPKATPPKADG